MVDTGSHKPKLAEDDPGAKAILPEPRSVKKQMPISMKTRLLILGSLMTVSAVTPVHRALGQICTNCVTPPAGLVAWWTGDGDANDLVGTNHGVFVNGAVAIWTDINKGT